jgi:hypothetical protein
MAEKDALELLVATSAASTVQQTGCLTNGTGDQDHFGTLITIIPE